MKKLLVLLCLFFAASTSGELWYIHILTLPIKPQPIPKPLLIYSFSNLKKTTFPASQIQLGQEVSSDNNSFSQLFYYQTPEKPNSHIMKKVSGLLNAPSTLGNYPVIVMFRGFVPGDIYKPGIGTEPVAQYLADHGYITLAPDFLGYGQSDSGADGFENRFQTYTTALSLLASLSTLNNGLQASYSGSITADMSHIGIWGHSNGGHIALSVLAMSGVSYPTVLWAPVSTSFPYSILYYTDEDNDQGKELRRELAQFEQVYNTDIFSPPNYYQWLRAPIAIEQGTSDEEVPYWWSDTLDATLTKNHLSVDYTTYPGADHNMLPVTEWNAAVTKTLDFYKRQFEK